MTHIGPNASNLLDRPVVPVDTDKIKPRTAATPDAQQAAPTVTDRHDRASDPSGQEAAGRQLPRGWGSHEDRRLMLWGVAGFFLLGLYAAAFILLGHLVWN